MPPNAIDPTPASPLTIHDWRAANRAGASPRARIEALHARLHRGGASPNWIHVATPAQLDAQLAALEAKAAAHPDHQALLAAMPLFGVPFAVKDNIDIAGVPTTAACPAFAYTPQADAQVVARLVAAGAVWIGKTNLDQFATGLVGARSPYGRPASAVVGDRISGGSSSGSAVVVSRGDVPFALGTDTAGSGRIPAGFNNIVGLKPTPGRCSTRGVLPACRSLDCPSVFALTVDDAALVGALIEGPDADDPYSNFRAGSSRFKPKLRVGVPREPVLGDDGYRIAFDAAITRLRALGHEPVAVDFAPMHRVTELLYGGPWIAERHAVVEELLAREPQAVDPVVRRVIGAAASFSATDAFRGHYRLKAEQRELASVWRQVDVLMVPTAPMHPQPAEVDADPVGVNALLGTYTNFVNLLGWCALALPSALTAAGLPFGVTFIAPGAADAALVRFGRTWEAAAAMPLGATGRQAAAADSEPSPSLASEPTLAIAVVGAHLEGLPLNRQLVERGASLREATMTAPRYRLFALPNTTPAKPGLLRVETGGQTIAVEVWELPLAQVGSFLSLVAAPLCIGSIELADRRWVHGFVCESQALAGAEDISRFGGWRAYLQSLTVVSAASPA